MINLNQQVTSKRDIILVEHDKTSKLTDFVANEVRVALVYNGVSHTVMLASPRDLEAFAVGFTLSERIVDNIDEIKGVELEHTESGILIHIEITQRRFMALKQMKRSMAGRTGCGLCGVAQLEEAVKPVIKLGSDSRFNIEQIETSLKGIKDYQQQFELTGATHAAMGLDAQGNIIDAYEDVGRHIALDKLIGASSLGKSPRPDAVLLTSRVSFEMVQKAASANIQILFALSAVTSLAIDLAEKSNLTLVGFCRQGRATIYCHSFRFDLQKSSNLAQVG